MSEAELAERLLLVRTVMERTTDPLDIPFALHFRDRSGDDWLEDWREHARQVEAGETHDTAVLYAHVPFCARVCSYCLLSASPTPGKGPTDAYVRALVKQAEMMEPIARPLRFCSLHVGGGTPTLLNEAQLDALLVALGRFRRSEDFQIGVEAHPATASPARIDVLKRHGVNRVSFGVETLSDEVLKQVNREDQTASRVVAAVKTVRSAGMAVNVDLLAGLPGETERSFSDSVRRALELEPDSMSVNRFLAENSALGREGHVVDDERADAMLVAADAIIRAQRPPRFPDRPLDAPGYGTQYVWHIGPSARPYFQQDMIGAASTLALGHGAMGHIHGRAFASAAGTLFEYVAAIETGQAPSMRVASLSPRFELAFQLADHACRGRLSWTELARTFHVDARRVFADELSFLSAQGLLRTQGDAVTKAPDRSFQVTHLLAFLLFEAGELRAMVDAMAGRSKPLSLRQYERIPAELPPSLLWCRIAIRSSVSARTNG